MKLFLFIRYAIISAKFLVCSDKRCQPCGKMGVRNSLEDDLNFPYYIQALIG